MSFELPYRKEACNRFHTSPATNVWLKQLPFESMPNLKRDTAVRLVIQSRGVHLSFDDAPSAPNPMADVTLNHARPAHVDRSIRTRL